MTEPTTDPAGDATAPAGADAPTLPSPRDASAFMAAAGLVLGSASGAAVDGHIELGPEHHQPWGIVHGGVYTAAVETAASVGASLFAAERGMHAVGVNNNTNFLRPLSSGRVAVAARPVQQGRTQQLWQVDITDDGGRLIATGQVRLANVAS